MNTQLIDQENNSFTAKASPFGWASLICLTVSMSFLVGMLFFDLSAIIPSSLLHTFAIIQVVILMLGLVIGIVALFIRRYSRTLPFVAIFCYFLLFILIFLNANLNDMLRGDRDPNKQRQLKGPIGIY